MAEYLTKEELEDYFGREYLTIYEMFGFGPDDYIQHWYKDEIWTRIIGWEEYYWISNKGRVWSVRSQKMLKHYLNSCNGGHHNGHWQVELRVNNKRRTVGIHQLLAFHFIPNQNDYPVVGHINDNRENNCLYNLEWCTKSKNTYRSYENGCREGFHGPVISINTNTGEGKYFTSIKILSEYLNINDVSCIYRSIKIGYRVKGHRVFDAKDFNLPPGLQDGDIIDSEVLYEN